MFFYLSLLFVFLSLSSFLGSFVFFFSSFFSRSYSLSLSFCLIFSSFLFSLSLSPFYLSCLQWIFLLFQFLLYSWSPSVFLQFLSVFYLLASSFKKAWPSFSWGISNGPFHHQQCIHIYLLSISFPFGHCSFIIGHVTVTRSLHRNLVFSYPYLTADFSFFPAVVFCSLAEGTRKIFSFFFSHKSVISFYVFLCIHRIVLYQYIKIYYCYSFLSRIIQW